MGKKIPPITNGSKKQKVDKLLGKNRDPKLNLIAGVMSRFDLDNLPKFKECLLEGDKVKLDVKKIKRHPSWHSYTSNYREFVEYNADAIFTVEYNETRENKPNLVCLKEDTGDPKLLWWDGELLVLDERDGKFKALYAITEDE